MALTRRAGSDIVQEETRMSYGFVPAPVLAQAAGGGQSMFITVGFFVMIIAVFYLLIIRPQKKREQERVRMIDSLKKGDRVVTIGGVHGVVVTIKEDNVVLRVDEERNVHMRFVKSAISRIVPDEEAAAI